MNYWGFFYSMAMSFNPLPNDKMLDVTKLKAFSEDRLNVAKKVNSLFHIVENTVGKGFSFSRSVLQSLLIQGH